MKLQFPKWLIAKTLQSPSGAIIYEYHISAYTWIRSNTKRSVDNLDLASFFFFCTTTTDERSVSYKKQWSQKKLLRLTAKIFVSTFLLLYACARRAFIATIFPFFFFVLLYKKIIIIKIKDSVAKNSNFDYTGSSAIMIQTTLLIFTLAELSNGFQ